MPFTWAPYVTQFNKPKYHVMILRAIDFATSCTPPRQILWVIAYDKPVAGELKDLPPEQLAKKKQAWLSYHDMATAGIMGTFPCVRNLPVRFTDTIDRNLKIFKHSRGVLVGWDLHEVDAERLRGFDGAEAVLTYKPKSLIVKIDGAE